ncbi:TIGR00297 family protein [Anthocerotibacter panamensis]|uniref:TIGR00297 family protein n=1 Tax=Anthocerotibacter panamensis TaxID=2857077 RepID=UPI001C405C44|nr:TIGR00297 family protein [Anthocerotibacter panamensis]
MNPWLVALLVNSILAVPASTSRVKVLTPQGILHSWALGVLILGALGWAGYAIIFVYFVVGTAATRIGFAQKQARGIAEKRGGARGPANVWGSAATAAVTALGQLIVPHPLWLMAYVASLATKLADTTSSEIGKTYGRTTYLITTFRPVPPGTEGAVSLEGTLAGMAAAIALSSLGASVGLIPWGALPWAVLAAFLATTVESLLGATIQSQGYLSNEGVNVLNTALGAVLGAGFLWLWG